MIENLQLKVLHKGVLIDGKMTCSDEKNEKSAK